MIGVFILFYLYYYQKCEFSFCHCIQFSSMPWQSNTTNIYFQNCLYLVIATLYHSVILFLFYFIVSVFLYLKHLWIYGFTRTNRNVYIYCIYLECNVASHFEWKQLPNA